MTLLSSNISLFHIRNILKKIPCLIYKIKIIPSMYVRVAFSSIWAFKGILKRTTLFMGKFNDFFFIDLDIKVSELLLKC